MKIQLIDTDSRISWVRNNSIFEKHNIQIVDNDADLILCSPKYAYQNPTIPVICVDVFDSCYLNSTIRRSALAAKNVKKYLRNIVFREQQKYQNLPIGANDYIHADNFPPKTNNLFLDEESLSKCKLTFPLIQRHGPKEKPIKLKDRLIDVLFIGQITYGYKPVTEHRQIMWDKLGSLKKHIVTRCQTDCRSIERPRIQNNQFFEFLRNSKIAICPFGFAAWSPRDLESLLAGTIVVKPKCDEHLIIPDIYNDQHMIWCKKDYSDLEEIVNNILSNLDSYEEKYTQILPNQIASEISVENNVKLLAEELYAFD